MPLKVCYKNFQPLELASQLTFRRFCSGSAFRLILKLFFRRVKIYLWLQEIRDGPIAVRAEDRNLSDTVSHFLSSEKCVNFEEIFIFDALWLPSRSGLPTWYFASLRKNVTLSLGHSQPARYLALGAPRHGDNHQWAVMLCCMQNWQSSCWSTCEADWRKI